VEKTVDSENKRRVLVVYRLTVLIRPKRVSLSNRLAMIFTIELSVTEFDANGEVRHSAFIRAH
jgi:hypothetical protein